MNWKDSFQSFFIFSVFLVLVGGVVFAMVYVFRGVEFSTDMIRSRLGWIIVIHPNDSGLNYSSPEKLAEAPTPDIAGVQTVSAESTTKNPYQLFNIPVKYSVVEDPVEVTKLQSPYPTPIEKSNIQGVLVPVLNLSFPLTNLEFMPTELAGEESSFAIKVNSDKTATLKELIPGDMIIITTNNSAKTKYYYEVTDLTITNKFDSLEFSREHKKHLALIFSDKSELTVINCKLI